MWRQLQHSHHILQLYQWKCRKAKSIIQVRTHIFFTAFQWLPCGQHLHCPGYRTNRKTSFVPAAECLLNQNQTTVSWLCNSIHFNLTSESLPVLHTSYFRLLIFILSNVSCLYLMRFLWGMYSHVMSFCSEQYLAHTFPSGWKMFCLIWAYCLSLSLVLLDIILYSCSDFLYIFCSKNIFYLLSLFVLKWHVCSQNHAAFIISPLGKTAFWWKSCFIDVLMVCWVNI